MILHHDNQTDQLDDDIKTTVTRQRPSRDKCLAQLDDPMRATVSLEVAAVILGIAKSTAHHAHRRTGYLIDGVRVIRVGRKLLVATAHLRDALGRSSSGG